MFFKMDKNDVQSKWFRLAVKLIVLLIVFKLGVLVGEFKMVKRMVGVSSPRASMWSGHGGEYKKYGGATEKMHEAFMNSPLHDKVMEEVGIVHEEELVK